MVVEKMLYFKAVEKRHREKVENIGEIQGILSLSESGNPVERWVFDISSSVQLCMDLKCSHFL